MREGSNLEKLKVGHPGGTSHWSLITAANQEGNTYGNREGNAALASTAFLVIRIDFKDARNDVYLWTNPALGIEPAVEDADVKTWVPDASFDTIVLRGQAQDRVSMDELRIGTSWADVSK